jgi:uncharacterized membrane protein
MNKHTTLPIGHLTGILGYFAGVTLSVITLAFKLHPAPCHIGSCMEVIGSSYGVILGIPVSVFGLLLWAGFLFRPRPCLLLLALGSIYFTFIQMFVLHAFCVYCCAHALVVFFMLACSQSPSKFCHDTLTRRHLTTLFLVGSLTGVLIQQALYSMTVRDILEGSSQVTREGIGKPIPVLRIGGQVVEPVRIREHKTGGAGGEVESTPTLAYFVEPALAFLAPTKNSKVLVVSLTCGHCLHLLREFSTEDMRGRAAAGILLAVNSANRDATEKIIAATLSAPNQPETFQLLLALAKSPKTPALLEGPALEAQLTALTPRWLASLPEAKGIVTTHQTAIKQLNAQGTPVLYTPDGVQVPMNKSDLL